MNWVARPSEPLSETSPLSSRAGVRWARICGRQTKLPERPPIGVTMLATWPVRPEMFSVAPSTISIRVTLAALIRRSSVKMSVDLPEKRSPLISTLPVAWPRPRRSVSPSSIEKPGTCSACRARCAARSGRSRPACRCARPAARAGVAGGRRRAAGVGGRGGGSASWAKAGAAEASKASKQRMAARADRGRARHRLIPPFGRRPLRRLQPLRATFVALPLAPVNLNASLTARSGRLAGTAFRPSGFSVRSERSRSDSAMCRTPKPSR